MCQIDTYYGRVHCLAHLGKRSERVRFDWQVLCELQPKLLIGGYTLIRQGATIEVSEGDTRKLDVSSNGHRECSRARQSPL